jgi:hypothetical protein
MNIAGGVIILMINPVMFLAADMNYRIVRPEAIGVNGRIKIHFTFDNCL